MDAKSRIGALLISERHLAAISAWTSTMGIPDLGFWSAVLDIPNRGTHGSDVANSDKRVDAAPEIPQTEVCVSIVPP